MRRIEVDFAIDVELTSDEKRELCGLIERVARRTTPEGHVHWLSEVGAKPLWSDADLQVFPDMPGGRSGAVRGEPEFDDNVLHLSTCCREK